MGESRIENILETTIAGEPYTDDAQSRIEALLIELKAAIEGGGGGTTDYTDLENKPQINGVTVVGNKSSAELKLPYAETSYIELASGRREYISPTVPTGEIPIGSIGVGFDEGLYTYKDGERTSAIDKFVGGADQYAYETCHINANAVNTDYKIYGSSVGVGVATQVDNITHYILPIVVIPELWINSVEVMSTRENPSAPEKKYLHPQSARNIAEEFTVERGGLIFYKGNVEELTKDTEGAVEKVSTSTENASSYATNIEDTGDGVTIVGYVVIDGEYYYGNVVHYDWDYVKANEPIYNFTEGATVVNIDIGTAPLYEDEYVDSSTGKVYRYVDGTLTPQNPPSALPTITSYAGQTRFAYDGENVPSKVSLTYTGWHSELDDINSRLAAIEQAIANV
jgi:hypothetical protein